MASPYKRRASFFITCIYFALHISPILADEGSAKEQANLFFEAALFDKAIPLYVDLLKTNPSSETLERLARSFFLSSQYENAISLLTPFLQGNSSPDLLYFVAASHRKKGQYQQAEDLLNTYKHAPLWNEHLEYELALNEFYCLHLDAAENRFKGLTNSKNEKRAVLSYLYLTRIDLAKQKMDQALKSLNAAESLLPAGDLLCYELSFLKGKLHYQQNRFVDACTDFESALPSNNPEKMEWYQDTLFFLGMSYLKGAESLSSKSDKEELFEKAEKAFLALLDHSKQEKYFLALGESYLSRAVHLQDHQAYDHGKAILSQTERYKSPEAQVKALLLQADAAPAYLERDALYRHLTREENQSKPFYSRSCYLQALNSFVEALRLSEHEREEADKLFKYAEIGFQKTYELMQHSNLENACLARKFQAQAIFYQSDKKRLHEALTLLDGIIDQNRFAVLKDPDEILYIYALIQSSIPDQASDAESTLQKTLILFPEGNYKADIFYLLGSLHMRMENYRKAEQAFLRIVNEIPSSPRAAQACFWMAKCVEILKEEEKAQEYRMMLYERYPNDSLAAEAYFTQYPFRDYVQGSRAAIKHLQTLHEKFPESHYRLHAAYLTALDFTRDRKSPEGKWIRKKNLTAAIESFHDVETLYEKLLKNGAIPEHELTPLTMMRTKAKLERAQTNLLIAEESQEAKKKIYLEYAEYVFQQLLTELAESQCAWSSDVLHNIKNECFYGLAKTYIAGSNDFEAERVLKEMLESYQALKITRGYLLSRAWYELGLIAMRAKEHRTALMLFAASEDAAKGKVLSKEQMLELWLTQSQCHRELKETDHSLILLSKAINDDAISVLRLKAMFLRAEIYEGEGRRELARKQLEALAKKGGEWAQKAQTKLDLNYGYK